MEDIDQITRTFSAKLNLTRRKARTKYGFSNALTVTPMVCVTATAKEAKRTLNACRIKARRLSSFNDSRNLEDIELSDDDEAEQIKDTIKIVMANLGSELFPSR